MIPKNKTAVEYGTASEPAPGLSINSFVILLSGLINYEIVGYIFLFFVNLIKTLRLFGRIFNFLLFNHSPKN